MTTSNASWLNQWNEQTLEQLTGRLRRLGADDPTSWAGSELRENIAQTARFLLLRGVWRRMDKSLDTTLAAVEDVRDRGGDVAEMREALVAALYEFAFDLVYLLDEPDGTSHDTAPHGDVADEDPRWVLMEQAPDGELTGRDVGNLHEDLWRDTQSK